MRRRLLPAGVVAGALAIAVAAVVLAVRVDRPVGAPAGAAEPAAGTAAVSAERRGHLPALGPGVAAADPGALPIQALTTGALVDAFAPASSGTLPESPPHPNDAVPPPSVAEVHGPTGGLGGHDPAAPTQAVLYVDAHGRPKADQPEHLYFDASGRPKPEGDPTGGEPPAEHRLPATLLATVALHAAPSPSQAEAHVEGHRLRRGDRPSSTRERHRDGRRPQAPGERATVLGTWQPPDLTRGSLAHARAPMADRGPPRPSATLAAPPAEPVWPVPADPNDTRSRR